MRLDLDRVTHCGAQSERAPHLLSVQPVGVEPVPNGLAF